MRRINGIISASYAEKKDLFSAHYAENKLCRISDYFSGSWKKYTTNNSASSSPTLAGL